MKRLTFLAAFLLTACAVPPSKPPAWLPAAIAQTTAVPPLTHTLIRPPTPDSVSCADLDAAWGTADWVAALQAEDRLEAAGLTCGDASLDRKRCAALINDAGALENASHREAAIEQYQAALLINGHGSEAIEALTRLNARPAPAPPACNPGELAAYSPSALSLALVSGGQFVVCGINDYPRYAPWDRFLTDGNLGEMEQELDLTASAGVNAVRIFLWSDPLFTCAPEDAKPGPGTFGKLGALIRMAAERHLRLVGAPNDLPDLLFRPLNTDYTRYEAQMAFIVNRYRGESAILAWAMCNEGDLNYGAPPSSAKRFERGAALAWLTHAAETVRAHDGRHLLTAG